MDPLQPIDILNRLRDYPHDNYLYIGGILKGIALYFACIAALEILHDVFKSKGKRDFTRISPWIASFAAITVSYMTWGRGVLLTTSPANLLDTIFPLWVGLAEFSLFALLSTSLLSQVTSTDLDSHQKWRPNWWFGALAVHSFLAVGLIWNRICQTDVNAHFVEDLRPLADKYVDWMWDGIVGAAITGFVALAFCILFTCWRPKPGWCTLFRNCLLFIVPLCFAAVLFFVAYQAIEERREIERDSAVIKAIGNRS
jgi:hypothetical protein